MANPCIAGLEAAELAAGLGTMAPATVGLLRISRAVPSLECLEKHDAARSPNAGGTCISGWRPRPPSFCPVLLIASANRHRYSTIDRLQVNFAANVIRPSRLSRIARQSY
jgi:hypothetical protein